MLRPYGSNRNMWRALALLRFEFQHFFHDGVDDFAFLEPADYYAFAVEDADAFAGGNTDVGFARFSGTVYHASEQRYLHRLLDAFKTGFQLARNTEQIYLQASAGGTGNDLYIARR